MGSDSFILSEEMSNSSSSYEPLVPLENNQKEKSKDKKLNRINGKVKNNNKQKSKKSPVKKQKLTKDEKNKTIKKEQKTISNSGKVQIDDSPIFSPIKYEEIEKVEPLKSEIEGKNWWEMKELERGIKWNKLKHNGVLFPPPYKPHGVKIFFRKQPVILTPEQEEAATWFAALIETDHAKNPIFRKNFFSDWKKLLNDKKSVIAHVNSVKAIVKDEQKHKILGTIKPDEIIKNNEKSKHTGSDNDLKTENGNCKIKVENTQDLNAVNNELKIEDSKEPKTSETNVKKASAQKKRKETNDNTKTSTKKTKNTKNGTKEKNSKTKKPKINKKAKKVRERETKIKEEKITKEVTEKLKAIKEEPPAKFDSYEAADYNGHIISNLDEVDFRPIFEYLQREKERKALLRRLPENKRKVKAEKEKQDEIYGYALVDGIRQKIGNYLVEIPGLFRGRGKHPKAGVIKKRIMPEDIIINVGENEKIPKCPIEGHKWGGVIHNHKVTYIAKWKDPITNSIKCVFLHASSNFKGKSDRQKYENARALKSSIDLIRKKYTKELESKDDLERQRATAMWIIDKLAIRVGNEKDTSKTADTVGVCTLRLEHIEMKEDNFITLDFLGKDSIQYLNTVQIDPKVYKNIKQFIKGKKKSDLIFHLLNTRIVNTYLSEFSKDLTAKVFRTFNASMTLQQLLDEKKIDKNESSDKKKFFYDEANRQVAILCNHKKAVPKTFDQTLSNCKNKLKESEGKLKELKKELKVQKKEKAEKKLATTRRKIKRMKEQIEKQKLLIDQKTRTKEIALGTSKINYMDPRITVSWCKKVDLPIEKVFPKALLIKFPWALSVSSDFVF